MSIYAPFGLFKRLKKRAIPIALIVAAVVLTVVLYPRERRLMDIARIDNRKRNESIWLSEQFSLYFHYDHQTHHAYTLLLHNEKTGNDSPLNALTRLFNASGGYVGNAKCSPDGKAVLWMGAWGDRAYAAQLDGSQYSHQPISTLDMVWTHDSRHWVEFEFTNGPVFVHSLGSPNADRQLPISPNSPLNGSITSLYNALILSEHHCFVSDCRYNAVDTPQSRVHIFDLDLAAGGMPTHTYTIHFPSDTKVSELVFTPQGDRIAWLLQRDYIPLGAKWLHKLFPAFKVTQHTLESIWVSRIDGSDMREIGFEETHPRPEVGTEIRGIYWLPDGKRLGFLSKKFWTVPAT